MNIKDIEPKTTAAKFGDINPGDVFRGAAGALYMKIAPATFPNNAFAVSENTIITFTSKTLVTPVEATLVIEGDA